MDKTDFSKITPCGGNCETCGFFHDGGCTGCRESGGKCVKMWENGCAIFKCCEEHYRMKSSSERTTNTIIIMC